MKSRSNKFESFIKIIIIAILVWVAFVFGYPDGGRLIIIGILIIGFGFWYKVYIKWYPNTKSLNEKIQNKIANNQELSKLEKFSLFNINSGPWMWRMCSRLGVAIVVIGFIMLIIK